MNINKMEINELLEIGTVLSKQKDQDRLMQTFMEKSMDITNCDRGFLYLTKGNTLRHKIEITKSQGIYCEDKAELDISMEEMRKENVCACAALERRLINIPNVYENKSYDFSRIISNDTNTGYCTTSMMIIPMEDDFGDIIGVIQLINAQDQAGKVMPFGQAEEQIVCSVTSQAAIRMTNINYSAEVITLLESFAAVMSAAIDARTPYNANHTQNMAQYGERFLDWLNTADHKLHKNWKMTDASRREFLMSIQLHDIGKLLISLEVMDKSDRLGEKLPVVKERFRIIRLCCQLAELKGKSNWETCDQKLKEVADGWRIIEEANSIGYLTDERLEAVKRLASYTYLDESGVCQPFITEEEYTALSVRNGTLTDAERRMMQSHVLMTNKMLKEMKFSRNYTHVPLWAADHHEFMNGQGYPNHKLADELPLEVRLLTILDVFEALIAKDRPYKSPMSVEKAFEILDEMVAGGQIDGTILELFKESKAWEE